jgi:hypothetical protein
LDVVRLHEWVPLYQRVQCVYMVGGM